MSASLLRSAWPLPGQTFLKPLNKYNKANDPMEGVNSGVGRKATKKMIQKGKTSSCNSKPAEVKEKPPCFNTEKEGGALSAHSSCETPLSPPRDPVRFKEKQEKKLWLKHWLSSINYIRLRWSCCSDDWLQALIGYLTFSIDGGGWSWGDQNNDPGLPADSADGMGSVSRGGSCFLWPSLPPSFHPPPPPSSCGGSMASWAPTFLACGFVSFISVHDVRVNVHKS